MRGNRRGMRWGVAVVMSAALLAGCASRGARPLTPEVRAQTFDLYWSELDRHYPFFGISGVDWDAERARWRERAVGAESPSEFYGVLAAMLSGLDDPHVMLRPAVHGEGDGPAAAVERVSSPFVGIEWIGRRAYVRRWPGDAVVVGGETGEAGEVPEGAYPELLAIDGVHPHRNMAALMLRGPEHTSVDLEARWPDGERRVVRVTRPPAEFGGGARSGWAAPPSVVHPALMAGTPLAQEGTLRREVAVKWDDGSETWMEFDGGPPPGTVSLAAVRTPGGGVGAVRRRAWGDWLTLVDMGEVGYLRLATLDYEDAGGGLSLDEMVEAFDTAIAELMDKPALILDLRYNGGGRPRSLAAVAGKLVAGRTALSSPERRFAGLVPYRYSTPISPRRPVYAGRLAVLINAETGSAAEHLASVLQREDRAKIVGERSTGAEALVEIVRGADGSELRYGWLRFVDGDGDGIQGVGVVPDVEVGLDIGRVREIGYAAAVEEVERAQFIAACAAVGVDGERVLGLPEGGEVVEGTGTGGAGRMGAIHRAQD